MVFPSNTISSYAPQQLWALVLSSPSPYTIPKIWWHKLVASAVFHHSSPATIAKTMG